MRRNIMLCFLAFSMVCAFSGSVCAMCDKPLETEKVAVNFAREVERGGYKIITASELKGWIDQKKSMLLVDAVAFEGRYKESHVPGAVQMEFPNEELTSLEEKKKVVMERLLGPDKDRLIVFYCGYTECVKSHNGAMWAVKLGYRNVYRQPGGITAWKEAGYSVEIVK